MQSQQEQQKANFDRLQAYRAKQGQDQRIRATVAVAVRDYSKERGLNPIQSFSAIRIATAQLEAGCNHYDAFIAGAKAVQIIARAMAVEKVSKAIVMELAQ